MPRLPTHIATLLILPYYPPRVPSDHAACPPLPSRAMLTTQGADQRSYELEARLEKLQQQQQGGAGAGTGSGAEGGDAAAQDSQMLQTQLQVLVQKNSELANKLKTVSGRGGCEQHAAYLSTSKWAGWGAGLPAGLHSLAVHDGFLGTNEEGVFSSPASWPTMLKVAAGVVAACSSFVHELMAAPRTQALP